jgi:hypothetical protein
VLREVEQTLKMTIDTNCPNPGIKITQDLDNALNEFLKFYGDEDKNIGYIASQIALIHLQGELEKAIKVVVDANNLKAYNEFDRHRKAMGVLPDKTKKKWTTKQMGFALLTGGMIATFIFLMVMLR